MQEVKAKGLPTSIRTTVAASLAGSATGNEFRTRLRERGIDLILRYGNSDRLFGATFIDHNTHTVLNGSALGKDFAANALAERFSDLATASWENRRPVQTSAMNTQDVPMRKISQPTIQPQSTTPRLQVKKKRSRGMSM